MGSPPVEAYSAAMPTELRRLWDFEDPEGSEQRFRDLAATSEEPVATHAWTQVARALGLQERYDEAHAALDGLVSDDAEAHVRRDLERGRLLRSAGNPDAARPRFEAAAAAAARAGLEELEVDALHMIALAVAPDEQLAAQHAALARARTASASAARDWDASILNNIGMAHADAGHHEAALAAFEEALAARERIGEDGRTRVARWMVAWSLRHLGHTERAREIQLALRSELDALGEHDPYVDEELGLLGG